MFFVFVFFFNDTATTEIYTLSLHDALPISRAFVGHEPRGLGSGRVQRPKRGRPAGPAGRADGTFGPAHGPCFDLPSARCCVIGSRDAPSQSGGDQPTCQIAMASSSKATAITNWSGLQGGCDETTGRRGHRPDARRPLSRCPGLAHD